MPTGEDRDHQSDDNQGDQHLRHVGTRGRGQQAGAPRRPRPAARPARPPAPRPPTGANPRCRRPHGHGAGRGARRRARRPAARCSGTGSGSTPPSPQAGSRRRRALAPPGASATRSTASSGPRSRRRSTSAVVSTVRTPWRNGPVPSRQTRTSRIAAPTARRSRAHVGRLMTLTPVSTRATRSAVTSQPVSDARRSSAFARRVRRSSGTLEPAAEGVGEGAGVAGRHQQARKATAPPARAESLGHTTDRGGDHRDAAGERLGQHHPVALDPGRQHDHVGGGVRRGESWPALRPGEPHPPTDPELLGEHGQLRGIRLVDVPAADADQVPLEVGHLAEGRQEHVVPLVPGERGDAQELPALRRTPHRRRPGGARRRHVDSREVARA